jgi:hypothetical protein
MTKFKSAFTALLLGTCVVTSAYASPSCQLVLADSAKSYDFTNALENSALSEKFGSICNMASYIVAECRLQPQGSIKSAIERLLLKAALNKSLPHVHRCGA